MKSKFTAQILHAHNNSTQHYGIQTSLTFGHLWMEPYSLIFYFMGGVLLHDFPPIVSLDTAELYEFSS